LGIIDLPHLEESHPSKLEGEIREREEILEEKREI
jgi:hypothetical protein